MSKLCFSFPADAAPAAGIRGAAQSGAYACSGDQAAVPLSMPFMCFSYPADEFPGQPGRKTNSTCFRYQGDISPGDGTQDAMLPGPRGKTSSTCFRY